MYRPLRIQTQQQAQRRIYRLYAQATPLPIPSRSTFTSHTRWTVSPVGLPPSLLLSLTNPPLKPKKGASHNIQLYDDDGSIPVPCMKTWCDPSVIDRILATGFPLQEGFGLTFDARCFLLASVILGRKAVHMDMWSGILLLYRWF